MLTKTHEQVNVIFYRNQKINNNEDNCIHKYGTDVFGNEKGVHTGIYM